VDVDDAPFAAALAARGIAVEPVVWTDPGTDWARFDLCLLRATWDYHERPAAFLDWVAATAAAVELWHDPAIVRWNADKRYLRELATAGVATVPTTWLDAGTSAALPALADRHGRQLVLKPVVSAGADGLHRTGPRLAPHDQAALDALLADRAVMVQPFLPEIERSGELSLLYAGAPDGVAYTGAVRKRAAAGDFRVQELHGGSVEAAEPTAAERALADAALSAARARLGPGATLHYARVDLVAGPDGAPCLIELELIEPRLYFRGCPAMAGALADHVAARIAR
jgi:glutathione synthase/RimK-type ligase-like ATP-grasp enzyme